MATEKFSSYIRGVASLIEVMPSRKPVRVNGNFCRDDRDAIQGDWVSVGKDLRQGLKRVQHGKKV